MERDLRVDRFFSVRPLNSGGVATDENSDGKGDFGPPLSSYGGTMDGTTAIVARSLKKLGFIFESFKRGVLLDPASHSHKRWLVTLGKN